ncbi:hypothetical protein O3P69_005696 [Scylla paramamosain]|uniref:Uncharacterized protein n=1 Tax=Scylla paramamosain TaxID=85552 RepID=A0AAW0U7R2_SCYPA
MRDAVTPGERLTLTLRYLASGETQSSLACQFQINPSLDNTDHPRSFPCYLSCVEVQICEAALPNYVPRARTAMSKDSSSLFLFVPPLVDAHVLVLPDDVEASVSVEDGSVASGVQG